MGFDGAARGMASDQTGEFAVVIGRDYLNFDFNNSRIYLPDCFVMHRDQYYTKAVQSSVSIYNGDGIQGLYFNKKTRLFIASQYNERISKGILGNPDIFLVACFWGFTVQKVFAPFTVKINGKIVEQEFYELEDRLLLPDKMFFVNGSPLPIYKSSIMSSVKPSLNAYKIAIQTKDANSKPSHKYFFENTELDPVELLGANLRFFIKQDTDPDSFYYKDVAKVNVDASTKAAVTPTVLMIGDSLTNRHLPKYLKDTLLAHGVTATMVGTMANDGGEKGEGREGWEFQNFIGADNLHGSTVITRLETGAVSTLYENPFLKLATSTDKTNYPTWCFRNTGANVELSYANDPDKTGDFYIFDFAWYLANHAVANPSVVTIALSTNDFSQESEATAMANSRLGLEIMVKQIRAALPTAMIGIVPTPVYPQTKTGNDRWVKASKWIEQAITDVASFGLTNADIIPVWAHMNRDFIFPFNAPTDISTANKTKKTTLSDGIHFGEEGKREYIAAVSAYVMNVI